MAVVPLIEPVNFATAITLVEVIDAVGCCANVAFTDLVALAATCTAAAVYQPRQLRFRLLLGKPTALCLPPL